MSNTHCISPFKTALCKGVSPLFTSFLSIEVGSSLINSSKTVSCPENMQQSNRSFNLKYYQIDYALTFVRGPVYCEETKLVSNIQPCTIFNQTIDLCHVPCLKKMKWKILSKTSFEILCCHLITNPQKLHRLDLRYFDQLLQKRRNEKFRLERHSNLWISIGLTHFEREELKWQMNS